MKQILIGYIILSIVILFMIYFTTIVIETNTLTTKLKMDLLQEGAELNDMESFIKYSTIAYQKKDQVDTTDYDIHIYHSIAKRNDEYINLLTFFVVSKQTVNYANSITDENDLTKMTIKDNILDETAYYDSKTDPNYEGNAISYGLGKAGVYYYTLEVIDFEDDLIEFYDYDGEIFSSFNLSYENQNYTEEEPLDFLPRYTTEEVNEMLDLTPNIRSAMIENYVIFILVDLSMGALLYYFMKWKKL